MYHPNRETLERYARGEFPTVKARWIEDHLRSGCPICQPSIDSLLPTPTGPTCEVVSAPSAPPLSLPAALKRVAREPAAAGLLPSAGRRFATRNERARPSDASGFGAHRRYGAARPADPIDPITSEDPVDAFDGAHEEPAGLGEPRHPQHPHPDAASRAAQADLEDMVEAWQSERDDWHRMNADVLRRVSLITSERLPAPRLLVELLAVAAEERATVVRGNRRFQTLALCELLIEASDDVGRADAKRAVELADLAVMVAQHLDGGSYGSAIVHDLQARAWAYLGRARRRCGDLAGARQALSIAEMQADSGSADPLEEAHLLELKASLLADQGVFDEAAEWMEMVIAIYDLVEDPQRKGQSLIAQGQYLGLAGSTERAIAALEEGLTLLEDGSEPDLALQGRHSLAWFLNECGRSDRAQEELDDCRRLHDPAQEPAMALHSDWLGARIAQRAGRLEEAEARFLELRRGFGDLDRRHEAWMVALDLAGLYLQQGRKPEMHLLAEEILPGLLAEGSQRQAAAALGLLPRQGHASA